MLVSAIFAVERAELKNEIDELRERNQALRTDAQEWQELFEQWKEAFSMVLDDDDMDAKLNLKSTGICAAY
jgi:FtsZ-binding cell division protein ZapB